MSKARRRRGRPKVRSDEETRAIILDAARSELVITGSGRMSSVARRAGVSSKTLYRLILSKTALLEAAARAMRRGRRSSASPAKPHHDRYPG